MAHSVFNPTKYYGTTGVSNLINEWEKDNPHLQIVSFQIDKQRVAGATWTYNRGVWIIYKKKN